MFKGKIFLVIPSIVFVVGFAHQPIINKSLDDEYDKRRRKRKLRRFRNPAGREDEDNCKEVKKVVIDQLLWTRLIFIRRISYSSCVGQVNRNETILIKIYILTVCWSRERAEE